MGNGPAIQAVILCAGGGSRIKAVTGDMPKCLLPVGGMTILGRQLDAIARYTGVPPVVVVGYGAEQVRHRMGGRQIRFVTNPEYASTNVITSLWYGLDAVKDDVDLLYMPGDLVFDESVIGLIMRGRSAITLGVQRRECDDEAVKVIVDEDGVRRIGKGVASVKGALEFTGMMKVGAALLGRFKRAVGEIVGGGGKGGYVFTAVQKMVDEGEDVGYADVKGDLWEEIDFEEDYEKAKKKFGG